MNFSPCIDEHKYHKTDSRGQEKNLVSVQVIERPGQAGCKIKPEATQRRNVLYSNHFEVVAIGFGDIHGTSEKLEDNLNLLVSQAQLPTMKP
jgi:hypothetical protein